MRYYFSQDAATTASEAETVRRQRRAVRPCMRTLMRLTRKSLRREKAPGRAPFLISRSIAAKQMESLDAF